MSLVANVAPHLPYLRRFARALTGGQQSGDAYVVTVLEALVADPQSFNADNDPRVELFRAFCRMWNSFEVNLEKEPDSEGLDDTSRRLEAITPLPRQAFLLMAVEEFTIPEVSHILGMDEADVSRLVDQAGREIAQQVATDVLIIEDEPLIAMDIDSLVKSLGHSVNGIARTHSEAIDAVRRKKPGLVLADIQLADGSSGLDAVNEMLGSFSVPVVFITAYPERLLTGERPEPAFLITKPFQPETVKAVISQALFFERRAGFERTPSWGVKVDAGREGRRMCVVDPRSPKGGPPNEAVMAKRVLPDSEAISERDLRAGHWSRCEAALIGSRITVVASDLEGRYGWVFNPPQEFPADLAGKLDAEAMAPSAAHLIAAAKADTITTGESRQVDIELEGDRGTRWFTVNVRPHYEAGALIGSVCSFIDVTESKVQEEHLRILLRELAHRSKNLLAVIQGIARQTAESVSTTDQFLSRFNGRIFSLSRAHDVLTDADWRGARIFDLVKSQIALYAEERLASVIIEGEDAFLRPNAAQYVGLALHELTTNALKYGALSRADGVAAVRFERQPETGMYRFTWRETSSAPIREPTGRRFGVRMLTEVVPTSVSGHSELTFAPEGLRYVLDLPAAQLLP